MVDLRPASEHDSDGVWKIFSAVIAPGDTYVFSPWMSREEALDYWFAPGTCTYLAEEGGQVVGTLSSNPTSLHSVPMWPTPPSWSRRKVVVPD